MFLGCLELLQSFNSNIFHLHKECKNWIQTNITHFIFGFVFSLRIWIGYRYYRIMPSKI
jgi:hypothetical protein